MQAIITRFLTSTDTKGPRVKAKCDAGQIVVPWDHALETVQNHDAACAALVRKLGWDTGGYGGKWIGGTLPEGLGTWFRCYVCGGSKKKKCAMLVYQGGIANVFEVKAYFLGTTITERESSRVGLGHDPAESETNELAAHRLAEAVARDARERGWEIVEIRVVGRQG